MAIVSMCNDFFRDCSPPEEYFEYGLWIPRDLVRDPKAFSESESSSSSGSKSGSRHGSRAASVVSEKSSSSSSIDRPPPGQPDPVAEAWKAKTGGSGHGTAVQAAEWARENGAAPSLQEVRELQQQFGDQISLDELKKWAKKTSHPDTEEELVSFMQYYDKSGKGTLPRQIVGNLLQSFGEPLTDAEVKKIFEEVGMSGDAEIDYRLFVRKLLE